MNPQLDPHTFYWLAVLGISLFVMGFCLGSMVRSVLDAKKQLSLARQEYEAMKLEQKHRSDE